jgi:uncharacterized membrane protein
MSDEPTANQEIDDISSLLRRLTWLAILAIIAAVVVVGAYVWRFQGGLSAEVGHWGQFGDYVGGVLNPTLSLFALIALLATFRLQVGELRMSVRELRNSSTALEKQNETLRLQNFESSFFQLLRLHNDLVGSIRNPRSAYINQNLSGRVTFQVLVNELYQDLQVTISGRSLEEKIDEFFSDHQYLIGHYFRLLYNIIKFVHRTDGIDKRYYTNLVRAQLSSAEVVLLFFNCLSKLGNVRFKPLVEEYSLLKTLPTDAHVEDSQVKQYSPKAFGGEYPVAKLK